MAIRLAVLVAIALIACTTSSPPTLDASVTATSTAPPVAEIPPTALSLEVVAREGALATPCRHPGGRNPPCSLESRARVVAGEPLHVVVRLRHTGAAPGDLVERAAGLDYDLEVTGPEGEVRPPTLYGKHRLAQRATMTPAPRKLAPGEVIDTSLFASRMVDVSDLGIYQLRVVRTTPAGTTRSEVFQFDVVYD